MESPIFIVGANRSGTTLLRLILNAHPHIAIPEEIIYFGSFMAGKPIEQWANPGLTSDAYAAFVTDFVEHKCGVLDGVDHQEIKQQILASAHKDFCHPYKTMLEAWAGHHGKKRWGEKTPGNLFYADILLEMFPDARFIHMIRDPRAGVSSMMKTTFFPQDIAFNAMSRRKFMRRGRQILETSVPAAQRLLLRYEDIVTEPDTTVKAICNFIGERFEPAMLSFYKDSSRYMKAEASTSFNKAATKPISAEMLDKWKKNLATKDIAMVEAICRSEMLEFGYDFSSARLTIQQRIELLSKNVYWKMQERKNKHIRHFTVKSRMFARLKTRLKNTKKRNKQASRQGASG
ncbi:MAG: sulfotransferase [Rhodothermales bacterium]